MIISVCIPAYNRSALLPALLDSILSQDSVDFEVVVAEDKSPERLAIRSIVEAYQKRYPDKIRYFENPINLGYDANLRRLLELAEGDYVFFMGNDDLVFPGALAAVKSAVSRYPNIGVLLRSYAVFEGNPENIIQKFRYFDRERFFQAGESTITTFYRRSVVISGMVIHRESALHYSTDRFDGTLLYQIYLVAEILASKNAVFIPDILALYRSGGVPDFGNSEAERGRFEPKKQTPESSLRFVEGMLEIAKFVNQDCGLPIFLPIMRDIANYSYPILSVQGHQSFSIFIRYGFSLARMGFWRYPLFWVYWLAILMLGVRRVDRLIGWVKRRIGYTPILGGVYKGTPS